MYLRWDQIELSNVKVFSYYMLAGTVTMPFEQFYKIQFKLGQIAFPVRDASENYGKK